jgi:CheY-like chemotaxis protein
MRSVESAKGDTSLILLVGEPRGVVRSVEPLLLRQGYVVSTADNAALARHQVQSAAPDAILLDAQLSDGDGMEFCRRLREDHPMTPGTVIVVITLAPPTRAQRVAALKAGACDCLSVDEEELLLRISALVNAKLVSERMRTEGQFDATTGLYNLHGLMQRAHELAALMVRQHGPLSCLVIALDLQLDTAFPPSLRARLAQSVFNAGRRSDVRGQIGATEFAILAPGTDAVGALGLAQRLAFAARDAADRMGLTARVRVGYEAIPNFGYEPLDPVVLLQRARTALRDGRGDGPRGTPGIRRFEATSTVRR